MTGKDDRKQSFPDPVNVEQLNVGFPVYAVEYSLASNTLFIAGGGGPAKSGVRNTIMSFKYTHKTKRVRELFELSCGEEAPMCMTIHPSQPEYLAVGVNDRCWIVERDETERLLLAKSIRTDFAASDSYQKIVRFSPDGHQLLTSGNEDRVRLWHFPWLTATAEFTAPVNSTVPKKETKIEDADYDKNGEFVAIVTPAGIHIRSKKENDYVAQLSPQPGYAFRCARFIADPKQKNKKKGGEDGIIRSLLVTIENSKAAEKPILCIWKTTSWTRHASVQLYTRLRVTTMNVSETGRLIAVGAADGTVCVYDRDLYLYYYRKEQHKFIVTSVVITDCDKARLLISGSGDGGVRIVGIRKNRPWTLFGLFFLIVMLVISFFFALFSAGLIRDDEIL